MSVVSPNDAIFDVSKIQEYVAGLKDLIWIVTDDGIGTLKKKNLVLDFAFSKHFTIFV